MRSLFFYIFFSIVIVNTSYLCAQDINCNLQVVTPQIQGTDKKIYETLQKALNDFVKNRKWTNFTFKPEESIECNILINITERVATDEFKGTLQVQARRPIFKTSYNSVLLNYIDKDIQFKYEETQPIDFDPNSHLSNLSSIVAYYIYVIIGLDFDTFSLYGGTQFYTIAQNIVNNAQNETTSGWKSFESKKNRYWMIENLLNQNYQTMREFLYRYHRKGFDVMYDNVQKGRTEASESLDLLKKTNREKPGLFFLTLLMFAKTDELVNIFSESPQNEKDNVIKILKEIDPANSNKYNNINKTK